ncbi:MAG: MMPL family transporter [Solirubrobacterales bacterium]
MRKSAKREARKNYIPDPANDRNIAARAGRWSATHPKTAIAGWFVFVAIALIAGGKIGTQNIPDYKNFSGESSRAELAIHDHFKADQASESLVVQKKDGKYGEPAFDSSVKQLATDLAQIKNVEDVQSPYTRAGPAGFVSADGKIARLQFSVAGELDKAGDKIAAISTQIQKSAATQNLIVGEVGDASADHEIGEMINDDLAHARDLSVPITLIILAFAFGALIAAGIPVLLALTAVMATIGLVAIPSHIAPMDESVGEVIVLIGMAVGVDYSLFYLKREREERAAGRGELAAIEAAAATSGRAVLISGFTVIAAMAGMLMAGDPVYISFGVATMMVVAVAMIGSLTVLPALLSAWGKAVDRPRIPFLGKRRERRAESGEASGMWVRIVDLVLRRPAISAVLATAVLLAMAYPALQMKTQDMSISDMPKNLSVLKAYEKLEKNFPSEGASALVVFQSDNVRSADSRAALADFSHRLANTDGFLAPSDSQTSKDGKVVRITVPLTGGDDKDVSIASIEQLRSTIIPETLGQQKGAHAWVTGDAASSLDFSQNLKDRAPYVFAFVLGLAFLLLLVTFRSVVIPLTAIFLNLLSVGAAYGVLVLVFQHGWGSDLLGFTPNGAIWPFLPLFLFVVLFGLSMDYHVFILSRMREARDSGMESADAVRFGIRSTAGVVTSAAIVMVAVFGIFASLGFLPMKQMGVGLAAAILVDATIIRAVLLPAVMRLLGEANWYLPGWLEWLPRVQVESHVAPTGRPAAVGLESAS